MSRCEELDAIYHPRAWHKICKGNTTHPFACFPLFYWETETTMVSTLCKVLCSMRKQQCQCYGFTYTLDISGSARISEHFHQLVPHNRFTFNKQMHGKKKKNIYEILTSQFTLFNNDPLHLDGKKSPTVRVPFDFSMNCVSRTKASAWNNSETVRSEKYPCHQKDIRSIRSTNKQSNQNVWEHTQRGTFTEGTSVYTLHLNILYKLSVYK